jgi:small subunit ribosomal protein S5
MAYNNNKNYKKRERKSYDKRVVKIRRVAKVISEGKRLRFSSMVVVGDRKGKVGVSSGTGVDTRNAVAKAERKAVKKMTEIQLIGDTVPHELMFKKGAAKLLIKPAKPGTGIIANAASRSVFEMVGIENVYCKQLGSNDMYANTYATFEALKKMRKGRVLKKMRKMRERIEFKEEMDKERAKLAKKKRAKNAKKDGRRKPMKKRPATKKTVAPKKVEKKEVKKEVKSEK